MLKDILGLLDKKDKISLVILFLLDIGDMVVSLLGIAVIVPYIFILFEPTEASSYPVFRYFAGMIPKHNSLNYILVASAVVLALYGIVCLYSLFYDYISTKIMLKMLYKYSRYLLKWYLERPSEYYFNNHSADIIHRYSVAAMNLLNGIVVATLELSAQIITIIVLILLLFVMQRGMALIPITVITLLCVGMYQLTKEKIQGYSMVMNDIDRDLSIKLQDSLHGITELRIAGKTDMALNWQIKGQDESYRYHIKRNLLMSAPDSIIDFFSLAMILAVLIISYKLTGNLKDGIVVLSVSVSASLQIRDTVMGIIKSFHGIRGNAGAYEEVFDEVKQATHDARSSQSENDVVPMFENRIELKNISYHYPESDCNVLENMNVVINKGMVLGISGMSGCGKTTLAQVILGLLKPQEGSVLIDDKPISKFGKNYLRLFGYVPQEIFLMDMSIEQNIAMEDDERKIDKEKVRRALEIAQLLDFVDGLPDGVKTNVGENGVRFSGGQRQRLGIARAIYAGAQVLVFDEATSSLDEETQERFIETVNDLRDEYTIIVIAHRQSVLKYCDEVLKM